MGRELRSKRCPLMLVAVFCGCDEYEGYVWSRGSEEFIAASGSEASEGRARDAAGIFRKLRSVCVLSDDGRYLFQNCLSYVLGDGGWDKGVWEACGPSSLSSGLEEEAVRCRVEGRQGYGEGLWEGAQLGREAPG